MRQRVLPIAQPLDHLRKLARRLPRPRATAVRHCPPADDAPEVVDLHQRRKQRAVRVVDELWVVNGRLRPLQRRAGLGFATVGKVFLVAGEEGGDVGCAEGHGREGA